MFMDFLDLVKRRKSTRSFSEKDISEEDLKKCLEAARLAPSACNSQPWKFIVVRGKRQALAEAALSGIYSDVSGLNRFVREAPVIVAIVNEKMKITAGIGALLRDMDYSVLDNGIAGEHLVLQAAELGIGTCWVGWFNEKKVKELLAVPKKLKVLCLIAMGYPREEKEVSKNRKSLEEIASFEKY
jgi:nitroreductase